MNKFLKIFLFSFLVVITMANANFDPPTIDTSDYYSVAGVILIALAFMFSVRSALKLFHQA